MDDYKGIMKKTDEQYAKNLSRATAVITQANATEISQVSSDITDDIETKGESSYLRPGEVEVKHYMLKK